MILAICLSGPALAQPPVRIGLTPVFLDDQIGFLRAWRDYLGDRLGRPVQFIRRASYAEIVEQLRQEQIDFAWICGFPFVAQRDHLELLAVPLYRGQPLYQSYLIVPISDQQTQGLDGLRNRIFAYSDPDSNSGYLVPQFELARDGARPPFFRKSFFTGSHRGVIEAVASRLADGGSVDGYVYDALARLRPQIIEQTRIVKRSTSYGFPPFVARKGVDAATIGAMRRELLAMNDSAEGRALLDALYLDGFIAGSASLFDEIAAMVEALRAAGRVP